MPKRGFLPVHLRNICTLLAITIMITIIIYPSQVPFLLLWKCLGMMMIMMMEIALGVGYGHFFTFQYIECRVVPIATIAVVDYIALRIGA